MSYQPMHHHFLHNANDESTSEALLMPTAEVADQIITMTPVIIDDTSEYNYAEALQKAIYFYEAQKSGPGVTGGQVIWRGDASLVDTVVPLQPIGPDGTGTNMSQSFIDAHRQWLDPEGKGTIDVSGGFYDAGDHVKFGLPQGYTASTLGWALYEFKQAFIDTELETPMLEILRWFTDYFLRSTFRNEQGDIIAFAYHVGDGNLDHKVWSPPEVQKLPRPVYLATTETPASDVCAEVAAALTLMYLNVKETDPTYATTCLDSAQALYRFASNNRGVSFSGGFYNSSDDNDELAWAAIWLYVATNKWVYLNDIIAVDPNEHYTGYLKKLLPTTADTWQNIWVHSWDTVWGGVFLKLAQTTGDRRFWDIARWNLEYWSGISHEDTHDTNYLAPTPAGFKVLSIWGSARYNATAQLCALMYSTYTGRTDFADWARGQMDYIMGKNPLNRSYIVGFSANAASRPHHRAAHGSFNDNLFDPIDHHHVLWGGLVGGPDPQDHHTDAIDDFIYNEVAIDYNAGLVGALAGLYIYYGQGQKILEDFPPAEPEVDQYFVEAMENDRCITLILHNDSIHPPHFERNIKVRYFFNSDQLQAVSKTFEDIAVQISIDEQKTISEEAVAVRGPLVWNVRTGMYYYDFDWSGYDIWGRRTLEFALTIAADPQGWDPKSDWSCQGLTSTQKVTPYIPVYLNGQLAYGEEPPTP